MGDLAFETPQQLNLAIGNQLILTQCDSLDTYVPRFKYDHTKHYIYLQEPQKAFFIIRTNVQ